MRLVLFVRMNVRMKSLLKKFVFLLILSGSINASGLPKGNSAWLYGKEESWVNQIQRFNTKVSTQNRIKYLFPETGIIHIDSLNSKLLIGYDPTVTKFYKERLKDVKIMPDLSFWVAHTNFKTWTNKQYWAAADNIAKLINEDTNADGVFLDLESYRAVLLPFYTRLVKNLQATHKIISVIVRPGQEDVTWFNTLGDNAFVVLYGYDLHLADDPILPISPEKYQQRLSLAVESLIQVAESTNMQIMGGIPVVATTYEWEQKIIDKNVPGKKMKGDYKQIDYFQSALKVYNKIQTPLYLGFSIWAFISEPKLQWYLPYTISAEEWSIMSKNKAYTAK